MESNALLARFRQLTSHDDRAPRPLDVLHEGNCIILQTGARALHRSRLLVRLAGAAMGIAGLALVAYSPWGWALAAAGLLALLLGPRAIRSSRLLEIDIATDQLRVPPHITDAAHDLPLAQVVAIRGLYETKGWDPFSTIYAELQDGAQRPVMRLFGGDERDAKYACQTLGSLLNCPATYQGPFGEVTRCHEPQRDGRQDNP